MSFKENNREGGNLLQWFYLVLGGVISDFGFENLLRDVCISVSLCMSVYALKWSADAERNSWLMFPHSRCFIVNLWTGRVLFY